MNRNSPSIAHRKCILALVIILNCLFANSQIAFDMSAGNYNCNFSDIANWSNNFNSGNGSGNWQSVGMNIAGVIPDGIKTTASSATFSSGTSGGIQKGNESIQFLSTGSTAFGNAVAVDLYFNFSNRIAGTLSFDYACVFNSTGNRGSSLKVYTSIDGLTWSELGISTISVVNNVSSSGTVSAYILPPSFNNSTNARVRFYQFSNDIGTTGSRAKISVDNIIVTSTSPFVQQEINIKQNQTIITNNGSYTFQNQNIGTSSNPIEFSIENLGLAQLTLSSSTKINISGTDATSFTANESATQDTILPMGYTRFTVTFNPLTAGYKSAIVTISNNDGDEDPYIINIWGTAVQATLNSDYFRSKQTGSWNSTNTWESSSNNTSWINATLIPDHNANSITITNSHLVTISSATSYDQLTVETGAQVTIAPGVTHTLNNGIGTDLVINGIWENTGSTWTTSGASWAINDGGTYIHSTTSAIATPLNTVSLSSGSNFIYRGSSTLNPSISVSGRTYGNLSFESSSSNWNVFTSGTNTLNIKGNFTIGNNVVYSNAQTGLITIEGNLINNGTLINMNNNQSYLFNGSNKIIGGTSSVTFNHLTINTSSSITIVSPTTITGAINLINGTLSTGISSLTINQTPNQTTGKIEPNNGTIFITNSSPITLSSSHILGNIKNLTHNGISSVTLVDSISLTGVLTLKNGTFDANNHLTLATNASIIYEGGTITNYSVPEILNNFTLANVTVSLSKNLTISGNLNLGNAIIDIGNKSLTINGNITRNTGTIRSNGGSLILLGTSSDTLYFDQSNSGISNLLKDFSINRPSTVINLGNVVMIADNGTVSVTAGTLSSNGFLKLTSTANGTGRIAELASGAFVNGLLEIQRFTSGGILSLRGWRCLSSPVSGVTYEQLIDDILITGPGGNTNGFDAHGNNSSVMYYEESATRGWKSITNITNSWMLGKGALVFFRGDRTQSSSITNTSTVPNSTVMNFNGVINSGNITVPLYYNSTGVLSDRGWNLIGNPYPSQINWANVNRSSNTDNYYYILNPITKNYISQNTGTIAIGQAFFVVVDSTTSITFEENDKTSNASSAYFKNDIVPFAIQMKLDSLQYDVAYLQFETGANANFIFKEDARKLRNTIFNVSILTPNNVDVQYNKVNDLSLIGADTFDIKVTSTNNTNYTLSFSNFNQIPSNKVIYLLDKMTSNAINLRLTPEYTFTINNNIPQSLGARFSLIIATSQNTLPLKLLTFRGEKKGNSNQLNWTSISEINMTRYEVQRAGEDLNFNTIGIVKPTNYSTHNTYSFLDISAQNHINYYRLKMIDSKTIDYSNTIVIESEIKNTTLDLVSIYPNPTSKTLNINLPIGAITGLIKISDVYGKTILETYNYEGIDISKFPVGPYILSIPFNNKLVTLKIIKVP